MPVWINIWRSTAYESRQLLDRKPFWVRYVLILGCLLATLYYGVWGPNVGAAAFVYMQF